MIIIKIHKKNIVFSSVFLVILSILTVEVFTNVIYNFLDKDAYKITYPVIWEPLIQNISVGLFCSVLLLLLTSIMGYNVEKKQSRRNIYCNSKHLFVEFDIIALFFDFNSLINKSDSEIIQEIETNKELFEKNSSWLQFYSTNWLTDNINYVPFSKKSSEYKTLHDLQKEIAKISLGVDGMKMLYLNNSSKIPSFEHFDIEPFDKEKVEKQVIQMLKEGSIDMNIHKCLTELEKKIKIIRYREKN